MVEMVRMEKTAKTGKMEKMVETVKKGTMDAMVILDQRGHKG
jgi:hypothetical protein